MESAAPVGEEPARWLRRAAIVVVWMVVLVQAWPWIGAPLLPFEDGALLFAGSYARFDLAECFASYAGYVSVGSRLLAAVCCRLPVQWIPSAFVLSAAACTAAAACALLHPAWRRLLSPWAQIAAAFAVVLPFGSYLMVTSLAYAQWALLWWLVLRMLHPEPRRGVARGVDVTLLAGLAWSHPLSCLLLPLAVVPELRRVDGARWLVLGVAVLGYWGLMLLRSEPGVPPGAGGGVAAATELLLVRGGLESLTGHVGRVWLQENVGVGAVWGAAVIVAAGFAWGLRCACAASPAALRWRLLAIGGFGAAVVVVSAWSRGLLAGETWIVRYVWSGRVAFAVTLALVAALWLQSSRWRAWPVLAVLLLGALLWRSNRDFYCHADGAQYVRMLCDELAAQEQRRGGREAVEAVLPRVQASIVVRPR